MRCCISPFGLQKEIVFVFEFRYKRQYDKKDWDEFLKKLADTLEFGTLTTVVTPDGWELMARAVKSNVIPAMIIAHSGKGAVQTRESEVSLAQYISSRGGIVIFTSELEKWQAEK